MAADGRTESIAVPLRRSRTISRSTASTGARERRWIRAAQRGSEEALEQLYRRHWPWAHRAAYLVVHDAAAAEDIAQEAFLAAVRALDRFDRRRPFGPWLNRIVVNRAIDWARARSLRREALETDRSSRPPDQHPSAATGSRPYSESVVAALASLSTGAPRGRRPSVSARVHAGRDRRIAGATAGTVNSRLRRALDRLRSAAGGATP